jgi:hypothetical protein
MGLDSVELLVEVEKTFGIEIPDLEAEKIVTVGDFYEAVWGKIKEKESDKCNSAILFYQLRTLLQKKYNIDRDKITPKTLLEDIIPKRKRRNEWKNIQKEIDLIFPRLKLNKTISKILISFGVIGIIGGFLYAFIAYNFLDKSGYLFVIPFITIVFLIILNKVMNPLRTSFPTQDTKELIDRILTLNYKEISRKTGTNRQEMEKIMQFIICDKAGVSIDEVRPEAKIVNDLGIN